MSSEDFFKRLRNHQPKPDKQEDENKLASPSDQAAGEKRQRSRPGKPLTPRQRQQRLAESFMENEALTEGLDEPAAKALIDWSMDLARRVVKSASELPAEQIDAHIEQRGEAARRLILAARDLALQPPAEDLPRSVGASTGPGSEESQVAAPGVGASPPPDQGQQELIPQIAHQAQEVYGGETTDERVLPPELIDSIQKSGGSPEQRITALRQTVENRARSQARHYSHQHDEEEDRDW